MKHRFRIIALLALATLPAAASAMDKFDGDWQTTVTCEPSRGALGFSYRVPSTIEHGKFHGQRGTIGKPSSLLVEGKVEDNGDAKLYAEGRTGSKQFVPGTDTPSGTEFGYHVKAHFDKKSGTGTRIEGRACTYEFEKQ